MYSISLSKIQNKSIKIKLFQDFYVKISYRETASAIIHFIPTNRDCLILPSDIPLFSNYNFIRRMPRLLFIILIFLCSNHLVAQNDIGAFKNIVFPKSGNYVYGYITDKNTHAAMAGVVIIVKNKPSIGAASDSDGLYVLSLPEDTAEITFSCIGYESKTIRVAFRERLDMAMTESSESIDEVVVTGYHSIKRESFTGNAIRIDKDAVLNANSGNLISAIQTFDPSFRLIEDISSGADPNKLPNFVMRGLTGIGETDLGKAASSLISKEVLNGNSNLPIFILDGFEVDVEKIYDLDINSIHSINILKDAAATAIYGSRAANGVIVIESRSPDAGKIRAHYFGTVSIETPDLSSYNLMNAKEKLEAERLAGLYDSLFPEISPYNNDYYRRLNNILTGIDTYWLSQGLRTSIDNRHSIFVDGGEHDVRWGIKLGYKSNEGVMKHSSRNSTDGSFSIDWRRGGIQIRNMVSFAENNSSNVPYNTFRTYSHLLPYLRLYDNDGLYVRRLERFGGYSGTLVNPLYEIEYYNSFDKSTYSEISDNLDFNWNISGGLKLKGHFSALLRNAGQERFKDPASAAYSSSHGEKNGEKTEGQNRKSILDGSISLIFNRRLAGSDINLCLSSNVRQTMAKASAINFRGFPGGKLISPNYSAEVYGKPVYSDNIIRMTGHLLTTNYSYKDIYLLDMTGRADGSSEFGADKRWSVFWAAGGGLNIHNYSFLKNNRTISLLKIRASYGLTGKTNFPLYSARDMYDLQTEGWYPTGYGVFLSQKGNPELRWERKYSFDAGAEIGLWKDRLYLRLTGYSERTVDLISDYTIPSSTGFTSYKDNMGKVKNTGIEIEMRVKLYSYENGFIQIFGNFAHNKNRIVEISQAMRDYNKKIEALFQKFKPGESTSQDFARNYLKYYEGASLTSIYGMKSLGISPSNGKEIYLKRDGSVTDSWSADEWSVIGDPAPSGQGSFGCTLAFGRFSLFSSFMYTFGGDLYNHTLVSYVENADIKKSNVDRRVLWDRWQKPGDITTMKDIRDRNKTTGASSRFVQKNNTLKFTSLTLNYSLPERMLNKCHISGVRLSMSVNDLFYISTIRRERGLDYPFSRSCSFTANITF